MSNPNYQLLSGLFGPATVEQMPDGSFRHTFAASESPAIPDRITVTPEIAELVGRQVLINEVASSLRRVRGCHLSADELRDQVVAALTCGGFREVTE